MAGYNGVALADELDLAGNLKTIQKVVKLAKALDVSVQATVKDLNNIGNYKAYALVKASRVDMLKINVGPVNADNIDWVKSVIATLRNDTLRTVTLSEETPLDDPFQMKDLVESGISKLDIYDTFAKPCAKAMWEAYDREPDKKMKGIMFWMLAAQQKAFANVLQGMRANLNNNLMHSKGKR